MEVLLQYSQSEQHYRVPFSKYKVEVSQSGSGLYINVSFKTEELNNSLASFSLPLVRAQQFAYAILAASGKNSNPVSFEIDEHDDVKI